MSEFEFSHYIIFLGGVTDSLREDADIFKFGIENIKESALKKIKKGLKDECKKKTYIDDEQISDEKIDEFLQSIIMMIKSIT